MCFPLLSTSLSTVVTICCTLACLPVFTVSLLRWITAIWKGVAGARGKCMRTESGREVWILMLGESSWWFHWEDITTYLRMDGHLYIKDLHFPPLPCSHLLWIWGNPVTTSLQVTPATASSVSHMWPCMSRCSQIAILITGQTKTIHITLVAYDDVVYPNMYIYSYYWTRTDEVRKRELVRQRESNWWDEVGWSVAAVGGWGLAFYLEAEYLKSGDCTVSWKLLQYFITAARSGIKSWGFFFFPLSSFLVLAATDATNDDECVWWQILKTIRGVTVPFTFCASLSFIHCAAY